MTLKLPPKLLRDAGIVASGQDVTIGHLVRQLLAKEVARRLDPKTPVRADDALFDALQTLLARDMAEATGWDDLIVRLRAHGYVMLPAQGDIALHNTSCGTIVCSGSDLGISYLSLRRRFGCAMPDLPHGTQRGHDDPQHHDLNSTEKGRIQRALGPLFTSAPDWPTLTSKLKVKGYILKPHGTGLAIYAGDTGRHLCNTASVGYRYRALVKKFSAPMPGHTHGAQWLPRNRNDADQPLLIDADPEFHVIERD